jgi:hypothetical protein
MRETAAWRNLGGKTMKTLSIRISEEEFQGVLQAYQTLQAFLEKIVSPNELYQTAFLTGLQEAQKDIKARRIEEVANFENFSS